MYLYIYIYVYISYITKYSNNILRFVRMIRNNFVCFFRSAFSPFSGVLVSLEAHGCAGSQIQKMSHKCGVGAAYVSIYSR